MVKNAVTNLKLLSYFQNCLLLKYDEVVVSLQQAYSLLLSNEISIIQYKVYASLSRLGYKVFRHLSKPLSKETENASPESACNQSKSDNTKVIEDTTVSIDKSDDFVTSLKNTKMSKEDNESQKVCESKKDDNTCNPESRCSAHSAMEIDNLNLDKNRENNASNKKVSMDTNEESAMIVEQENSNIEIQGVKKSFASAEVNLSEASELNTYENNALDNIDTENANLVTDSRQITIENIALNEHANITEGIQTTAESTSDNDNKIIIKVIKDCKQTVDESITCNENLKTIEDCQSVVEKISADENITTIEDCKSNDSERIIENVNLVDNSLQTTERIDDDIENVVVIHGCSPTTDKNITENEDGSNKETITSEINTPMEIDTVEGKPSVYLGLLINIYFHIFNTECILLADMQPVSPSRVQNLENTSDNNSKPSTSSQSQSDMRTNVDPLTKYCQWKLEKLKDRQAKSSLILDIHKCFKDCPDISENQIVTIKAPKEEYLPENTFLNNLQYVINVENVRSKNVIRPTSTDSSYSLSDEVNGAHIRRVTNVSTQMQTPTRAQTQQNSGFPPFFPTFRPNIPFRQFNFWRPRPHNYYQFNLFFQRPFVSNFNPRFQFYPRMHIPMFPRHTSNQMDFSTSSELGYSTNTNARKRPKDHAKKSHFENLKNLAQRLKNLNSSPTMRAQNIEAIQSLIHTYNLRFRTRVRLTEQHEIVNDETIVDTINLDDDDEESRVKKPKLDGQPDLFLENFNRIRQTAYKLKKLEAENKATARHRRALSGVIKTFNKHFDADIYMTENYDVINRRYVNLDSSSDSDCVVEEIPKVKSGKKLRNPFNILKKLSEKKASLSSPSTSRSEIQERTIDVDSFDSQESLQRSFGKNWLPNDNDFGKPEVIPRDTMVARILEAKKEEFLFDFQKDQPYKFNNWLEIKIAFLESIEETNAILRTGAMIENNVDIKSLVKSEECSDMGTVLKKLSIIKCNKTTRNEPILTVDYDVYNRDVKNFRKTNRPKPHFRVVCIE